jgi:hypothetical protein
MNDGLKIKRCTFLPEGEMAIVKDTYTLIHNIVDSELEEKDKEIQRLNNIINEIRKYLKDNEREYGSLEDNEKIILRIIESSDDNE